MALWLTAWALASEPASETPKEKVVFSGTEDFELRYWRLDDRLPDFPDSRVLDYVEQVNRVTLDLSFRSGVKRASGPLTHSVSMQIDEVALFANRYYLDEELQIERDLTTPSLKPDYPGDWYINPEKWKYSVEGSEFSLAFGDSYAAFGRGIALNLNRNVDIDIDTSISGIKAVFRPGLWDVTAVMGQANRQQVYQDNPNVGLRPDVRHGIAGVRVERFGLGPINAGVHGVIYDFVQTEGLASLSEPSVSDAIVGGGTVEAVGLGGVVDAYVEADIMGYTSTVPFGGEDPKLGYALYGSTSAYVGPTTWLFEVKRYKDSERINAATGPELYKMAVAPTLEYERVVTEDSSSALGSNDIVGARLRMDWTAIPQTLVPYASVGIFRDNDLDGGHFNKVPETIFHPMVGVESVGEHLTLIANGGVRVDDRAGTAGGADRQIHADVDFKYPLFKDFHGDVALNIEQFHWGNNPFQQTDYFEVESAVSLQKGSMLALTGFLDYSSNPLVDSTGNVGEDLYAAVEFQVKPLSAMTIKAFYGSYSAGIRCSGGQCRLLPGFEGARVSLVASF